jgi:hypothetical protein
MKRSTGLNESCLNVCWELAHSLRMPKASQFCLTVSKMLLSMHLAVVSQKNGSNRLWTTPPMKLGRSSDTHEFPSYYNPIGKTWLTSEVPRSKHPTHQRRHSNTVGYSPRNCWENINTSIGRCTMPLSLAYVGMATDWWKPEKSLFPQPFSILTW